MVYTADWGIICHLPPFRGTRNNHWNHLQFSWLLMFLFVYIFCGRVLVIFCVDHWNKKQKQHKTRTPRKCETEIDWCLVNKQEMASLNLQWWANEQVMRLSTGHWPVDFWNKGQDAHSYILDLIKQFHNFTDFKKCSWWFSERFLLQTWPFIKVGKLIES